MPKRNLAAAGGIVFHVLNRSVRRMPLFTDSVQYDAFQWVLREALDRLPIRLLAYCVMPNHWHLVVWPTADEMPRFMHWLTVTHTRRWHLAHGSTGTGHVYQNRYGAIPVQSDRHLIDLLRYVERNALRAHLVARAEEWRWCSLWQRRNAPHVLPLSDWPIAQPADWVEMVNQPQTQGELREIQLAIGKRRPLGDADWSRTYSRRFGTRLQTVGRRDLV